MGSFTDLMRQGVGNAWLFVPSALLLGALHGLEPGHSKTMMAAFIVAARGTVPQAILLGVSATLSHTAVVWAIALIGMRLGSEWQMDAAEPYFQIASSVLIAGVALWMLWRTWRDGHRDHDAAAHEHGLSTDSHRIDTGHGVAILSIFEDGVPPRFRIQFERSVDRLPAAEISIVTRRADGSEQAFAFRGEGTFLESVDEIPEPHAFIAQLQLGGSDHRHDFDVVFSETSHEHGLELPHAAEGDAHARAHAADIRNRFVRREVTTAQIVVFGLTGGLVPCPAAITVLLLCLQLREFMLGVALVLCFSIGLAIVMVASGVIAAVGVRHIGHRWQGFETILQRAPYVSSILILCIALVVGREGVTHLP